MNWCSFLAISNINNHNNWMAKNSYGFYNRTQNWMHLHIQNSDTHTHTTTIVQTILRLSQQQQQQPNCVALVKAWKRLVIEIVCALWDKQPNRFKVTCGACEDFKSAQRVSFRLFLWQINDETKKRKVMNGGSSGKNQFQNCKKIKINKQQK